MHLFCHKQIKKNVARIQIPPSLYDLFSFVCIAQTKIAIRTKKEQFQHRIIRYEFEVA